MAQIGLRTFCSYRELRPSLDKPFLSVKLDEAAGFLFTKWLSFDKMAPAWSLKRRLNKAAVISSIVKDINNMSNNCTSYVF